MNPAWVEKIVAAGSAGKSLLGPWECLFSEGRWVWVILANPAPQLPRLPLFPFPSPCPCLLAAMNSWVASDRPGLRMTERGREGICGSEGTQYGVSGKALRLAMSQKNHILSKN